MSNSLKQLLEPYGAPKQVVDLREETPDGIPYIDLLQGDRGALPDGVVETKTDPLAYVVDGVSRSSALDLPSLRKTVAFRGDAPYLVIVEPGRLVVYDTSLPRTAVSTPLDTVDQSEDRAGTVFSRLNAALLPPDKAGRLIHDLLFDLLDQTICQLQPYFGQNDAISLAGRALFMRFLIDRGIVTKEHMKKICPNLSELFTGQERATATCLWLNATFNGDFLPLKLLDVPPIASAIPKDAFAPLENVMYRSLGGQLRFDWATIDFAHIPVGLMSQVYERQSEMWDPAGKRRQGVYYTPRRIADFMIKEVFAALSEQGPVPAHEARVLDPAVGGGVFLVSAFQEIVAAWWQHHGRPPDTGQIRSILYEQLTGFDISEPALQLTALSLYLKAIELDLDPHPPAKLRFRALRGRSLYSMRKPGEENAEIVLGSLGPQSNSAHHHHYDIVIGNPPWTPLERKWGAVHARMVKAAQPIVAQRIGEMAAKSFTIPDHVPDLLFAWRALDWAKPSGWIALALHGRLLFKNSGKGRKAREDLFQAVQVTGLLNGADLRKTQVWPGVEAPFCLLFARNQPADEESAFHFASPYLEENLNQQGRLRIDSGAAQPIELRRFRARPDLLKALFRGTALDVALLGTLREKKWPPVKLYFREHGLKTGQGYQVGTKEREVPRQLLGKPELQAGWTGSIRIETDTLPRLDKRWLQWPRRPEVYRGPLALVRESLSPRRESGRALCCFSDLVYSESYYGYSACGHPEAELLVRYLVVLIHSDLFSWHSLITSSKFGVERDSILKEDIDGFLLRPLEGIPKSLQRELREISELLFQGEAKHLWPELDAWIARVYGLSKWDQEVIRDTLAVALPFPEAQKSAQRPPEVAELEMFATRIERELLPFAEAAGKVLRVRWLRRAADGAPWEILLLETQVTDELPDSAVLDALFQRANHEGASQIRLMQPERGRLLLGILREYRYWTPTRARLTALELLKEHLGSLLGSI